MLKNLKFVQGAVARKDFVPAMTHFVIDNGFVRAWNGNMALCSPINFDIACKPKAKTLVQAIAKCPDDLPIVLSMTPGGKLRVKGGKFSALVDCIEGETNHAEPTGEFVNMDCEGMFNAFKALAPIVGDDAARPWANGMLLRGPCAYATCNVVAAQYWIGSEMPLTLNVPMAAINEVLRINEVFERVQCDTNSISFHYSDKRWIRTNLYSTEWPDIDKLLSRESNPTPINEGIFEAVEKLKPFADKVQRIYFQPGKASTHSTDDGATFEFEDGYDMPGVYSMEMLSLLKGVAKTIDFSAWPSACMFFGDRLRGAIIGMKQ